MGLDPEFQERLQKAGDLPWQSLAECKKYPSEWFFGEEPNYDDKSKHGRRMSKQEIMRAKEVCAQCKVRLRCLDEALGNEEKYGIWGGLTDKERRRLNR